MISQNAPTSTLVATVQLGGFLSTPNLSTQVCPAVSGLALVSTSTYHLSESQRTKRKRKALTQQ